MLPYVGVLFAERSRYWAKLEKGYMGGMSQTSYTRQTIVHEFDEEIQLFLPARQPACPCERSIDR
jgi:hypothetical protein